MNIDQITIGEAREIMAMLGKGNGCSCGCAAGQNEAGNHLDSFAINETVIIRTYSAGVWCGVLEQKAGNEVILKDARRMWRWWCAKSISLSGVARHGIRQDKSKIAPAVEKVWLEAIEIIPITGSPAKSIMEAPDAEAE